MNKDEVFEMITKEHKWYSGIFSVQSASRILRKHREGVYKNYDWLFNKFGYKVNSEKTWVKK